MSKLKLQEISDEENAAINRGIAEDSDTYEVSTEQIKRMRPFSELLTARRGRPPVENPKEQISVRYDADILAAFRSTGDGWQTRMNMALRVFLKEHPLT